MYYCIKICTFVSNTVVKQVKLDRQNHPIGALKDQKRRSFLINKLPATIGANAYGLSIFVLMGINLSVDN